MISRDGSCDTGSSQTPLIADVQASVPDDSGVAVEDALADSQGSADVENAFVGDVEELDLPKQEHSSSTGQIDGANPVETPESDEPLAFEERIEDSRADIESLDSDLTEASSELTDDTAVSDDSPESYQAHLLEEEASEPDFVAHVEDPPAPEHRIRTPWQSSADDADSVASAGAFAAVSATDVALAGADDGIADYAEIDRTELADEPVDDADEAASFATEELEPGVLSAAKITNFAYLTAFLTGRRRADAETSDESGLPREPTEEFTPAELEADSLDLESQIPVEVSIESDDSARAVLESEVAQHVPYASVRPEDSDEDEPVASGAGAGGGLWTIPLVCLGLAILATCLILPSIEANRRLVRERSALRGDLESVQKQVATNDEFLRKLAGDPTLAERLAQRQMKLMRPGTRLLPVGQGDNGTSPFDLVQVTPPAPMEPYQPLGGTVATLCSDPHKRVYLMGGGLFILAAGLVLGAGPKPRVE